MNHHSTSSYVYCIYCVYSAHAASNLPFLPQWSQATTSTAYEETCTVQNTSSTHHRIMIYDRTMRNVPRTSMPPKRGLMRWVPEDNGRNDTRYLDLPEGRKAHRSTHVYRKIFTTKTYINFRELAVKWYYIKRSHEHLVISFNIRLRSLL